MADNTDGQRDARVFSRRIVAVWQRIGKFRLEFVGLDQQPVKFGFIKHDHAFALKNDKLGYRAIAMMLGRRQPLRDLGRRFRFVIAYAFAAFFSAAFSTVSILSMARTLIGRFSPDSMR